MLLLLGAIIIYHVIQKLHNMHVTISCSVVYSVVIMKYIKNVLFKFIHYNCEYSPVLHKAKCYHYIQEP